MKWTTDKAKAESGEQLRFCAHGPHSVVAEPALALDLIEEGWTKIGTVHHNSDLLVVFLQWQEDGDPIYPATPNASPAAGQSEEPPEVLAALAELEKDK